MPLESSFTKRENLNLVDFAFDLFGSRFVGVVPTDFVTLGSGAKFALEFLSWSFESTTTAHFLKDTFCIELGLESLESAINGLTFFHFDSAEIFVCHICHQFFLGARRLESDEGTVK